MAGVTTVECARRLVLVFMLAMPVLSQAQEQAPKRQTDVDFRPRRMLSEQPAITEFETKSAADADRVLDPSELVLGVVLGDQARAYPINMLTGPRREIINDVVNERPIAATW